MTPDEQKRAVGEAAAQLVETGMLVGLGTGSTAAWFVKALAARALDIRCVPTSLATEALAMSLGLKTLSLDEAGHLDLTVDGADEIGPGLALIKGGGAALLREKLVWEASEHCVVIADAAKQEKHLGAFPLPIEVVAFGYATTEPRITAVLQRHGISAAPVLRRNGRDVVRTDSQNVIFDVACGAIPDPSTLAAELKLVTGVVEHGLFLGLAQSGLLGAETGVLTLRP